MAHRVVIVGYGLAGRSFHGYLIRLVPGLIVHGVVARDPAKQAHARADFPAARVYPSLDDALTDPAVNAVVIATPHDTHHPMAIQALSAGKHVITDKPMCLSLAQAREMFAAASNAARRLLVFHNRRWDNDFLTLQHAIAAGTLGPPESVNWVEMNWNRHGIPKAWRSSGEAGGGRLFDLGSHLLDQLLLLFPRPVLGVHARAHYDFADPSPSSSPDSAVGRLSIPSHCQVTLAFEGGGTGVIDVGSLTRFEKPRLIAVGRDATFVKHGLDPQEAAMKAGDIDAAVVPVEEWPRLYTDIGSRTLAPVPGRWRSFYEHVSDVLSGHAEPLVTPAQMLRLMSVLDAAHASIRTGQTVRPESAE